MNLKEKRTEKINVKMSSEIKGKTSAQCRSHHQKMIKHYKTIEGIIAGLQIDILGRYAYEEHPSHHESVENVTITQE